MAGAGVPELRFGLIRKFSLVQLAHIHRFSVRFSAASVGVRAANVAYAAVAEGRSRRLMQSGSSGESLKQQVLLACITGAMIA
jgi:hypothetical protein